EIHAGGEHGPLTAQHDTVHVAVRRGLAPGLTQLTEQFLPHRVAVLRASQDDVADRAAVLGDDDAHRWAPDGRLTAAWCAKWPCGLEASVVAPSATRGRCRACAASAMGGTGSAEPTRLGGRISEAGSARSPWRQRCGRRDRGPIGHSLAWAPTTVLHGTQTPRAAESSRACFRRGDRRV